MRNVNISLSPPAADEEDGRKAPGPAKQTSVVMSIRLGPDLASAVDSKARELGMKPSSVVKDAIASYTRKLDTPQSRRELGSVLGELIQLRIHLNAMQTIYSAQAASGREPDAATVKALFVAYRSIIQAAERISS